MNSYETSYETRKTSELGSITEEPFPFTNEEQEQGVSLVSGSLSHQLWELLANRSKVLVHPYHKQLGTIEDLSRQLVSACEEEISLHADHCGIADRVAYIKEKNEEGVYVKDMSMRKLLQSSQSIFSNWDNARARVKVLEKLWMAYRNDRVRRLVDALVIYRKINTVVTAVDPKQWAPDTKFAAAMQHQIKQLEAGVKMSPYYEMQNCVSHLIQRPLFASSELSRTLEMSTETDPHSRSPITGSVAERMQLLSVAW